MNKLTMLQLRRQHIACLYALCLCALCMAFAPHAVAAESLASPSSLVFETETVTLKNVEVYEYEQLGEDGIAFEPATTRIEFYDITTQSVQGRYWIVGGILPEIQLTRGHTYMVSAYDAWHEMVSVVQVGQAEDSVTLTDKYYLSLDTSGAFPTNVKDGKTSQIDITGSMHMPYILIQNRQNPLSKAEDARRVSCNLPVYIVRNGQREAAVGVKVRLTSPEESIVVQSNTQGVVNLHLLEESNYMVSVDDASYSLTLFPLVMKDMTEYDANLAEDGWAEAPYKYPFNHMTSQRVEALELIQKGSEHDSDTTITSASKKTTVSGMHFDTQNYILEDYVLDNNIVSNLDEDDFEVVSIACINTHFAELSKLAAGQFAIERTVPNGKNVKDVYYLDDQQRLHAIAFKQTQSKVAFTMDTLSVYPVVIVYEPVDKTALKNALAAARATQDGVKVSTDGSDVFTNEVWTTALEKQALNAVIAAAQNVVDAPLATQAQVDAVTAGVKAAKNAFDLAKKPGKKAPVTTKTALKSATAPAQKYTGKALKPAVTVKDAKGKVVPASAYTVTYANNTYPGTATATVKAKANSKYTGTVKATFKITAAEQGVYWLVNKKTGENLYTTAVKEVNTLSKVKKTWINKGIMWYAPTIGEAVYRLVNKKTGDHHFTKSTNEVRVLTKVKKTWTADFNGKPIFYSGGPKKVWRQYSDSRQKAGKPGTHKFTTINAKLSGWKNEGALLYALRYGKVNGVKR